MTIVSNETELQDQDGQVEPGTVVEGMPEADPVPEFEPTEFDDAGSMREAIFAVDDIPEQVVPVPEWKMHVLVRGMSGHDSVAIMETATEGADQKGDKRTVDFAKVYPDVVILTAHHPQTRERLFRAGDRKALLGKSGAALNRLATAGMKLSGLTDDAKGEAGKGS